MQVVAMQELEDHLGEYVRRAQAGETLLITSHGEVVAELRSSKLDPASDAPLSGLQELVRRGTAHGVVRNDPSQYRTYERVTNSTTAQDLLNWDRNDR
ncbi:MAG: type II toxin-antitoxin system prevent-host-death family antitoxin [Acidobacteriota bacterium]